MANHFNIFRRRFQQQQFPLFLQQNVLAAAVEPRAPSRHREFLFAPKFSAALRFAQLQECFAPSPLLCGCWNGRNLGCSCLQELLVWLW